MRTFLIRTIAVFLLPCLVVDPALVEAVKPSVSAASQAGAASLVSSEAFSARSGVFFHRFNATPAAAVVALFMSFGAAHLAHAQSATPGPILSAPVHRAAQQLVPTETFSMFWNDLSELPSALKPIVEEQVTRFLAPDSLAHPDMVAFARALNEQLFAQGYRIHPFVSLPAGSSPDTVLKALPANFRATLYQFDTSSERRQIGSQEVRVYRFIKVSGFKANPVFAFGLLDRAGVVFCNDVYVRDFSDALIRFRNIKAEEAQTQDPKLAQDLRFKAMYEVRDYLTISAKDIEAQSLILETFHAISDDDMFDAVREQILNHEFMHAWFAQAPVKKTGKTLFGYPVTEAVTLRDHETAAYLGEIIYSKNPYLRLMRQSSLAMSSAGTNAYNDPSLLAVNWVSQALAQSFAQQRLLSQKDVRRILQKKSSLDFIGASEFLRLFIEKGPPSRSGGSRRISEATVRQTAKVLYQTLFGELPAWDLIASEFDHRLPPLKQQSPSPGLRDVDTPAEAPSRGTMIQRRTRVWANRYGVYNEYAIGWIAAVGEFRWFLHPVKFARDPDHDFRSAVKGMALMTATISTVLLLPFFQGHAQMSLPFTLLMFVKFALANILSHGLWDTIQTRHASSRAPSPTVSSASMPSIVLSNWPRLVVQNVKDNAWVNLEYVAGRESHFDTALELIKNVETWARRRLINHKLDPFEEDLERRSLVQEIRFARSSRGVEGYALVQGRTIHAIEVREDDQDATQFKGVGSELLTAAVGELLYLDPEADIVLQDLALNGKIRRLLISRLPEIAASLPAAGAPALLADTLTVSLTPEQARRFISAQHAARPTSARWMPAEEEAPALMKDLLSWLGQSASLEWQAGPRYGQARIQFRDGNDISRIEIYPADDWSTSSDGTWRFPEMKNLQAQRELAFFYPKPGAFGQMVIDFRMRDDGQVMLLISEIQPSEGYRQLSQSQRRQLDLWRAKAVERIAEWALLKNIAVYGNTPEEVSAAHRFHKMTDYELRTNYVEPYDPSVWEIEKVDALDRAYAQTNWRGPIKGFRWWAHRQNRTLSDVRSAQDEGPMDPKQPQSRTILSAA